MAARCFYSGRIVDRADCGMGATESVNATRRSYRRLVGFITFYSLRWIAGIVLRKEALGMGDVLLFAALGGWVGPLSLPNVALIASCFGLIYAVITKRINHTAFWTVFKSGRYGNTLSTGIVLMITTSLLK